MKNNKKRKVLLAGGAALCLCLLIALEGWRIGTQGAVAGENDLYTLLTSGIGSALFLLVLLYNSDIRSLRIDPRAMPRQLLLALPCFAVAVNNFPWIPFFSGKAYFTEGGSTLWLYFLTCMGIGLFEELVFRGYLLMMLLDRQDSSRKGLFISVIVSSAIFGLVHLLNLFVGADPLATLLQVGYSFLIGAMCAIVLIRTGSIWYPVLLHGIYNFAGGVIPRFGGGSLWDAPTVILTAILALAVGVYMTVALYKTDTERLRRWLKNR